MRTVASDVASVFSLLRPPSTQRFAIAVPIATTWSARTLGLTLTRLALSSPHNSFIDHQQHIPPAALRSRHPTTIITAYINSAIAMLPMAVLALSLLGFTAANALNTVRIPAYRKTLSVDTSATLVHPINYNDRWVTFGFYFIELGIGTPPQQVRLALDTGSRDTWVPFTNAPACLNVSECPAGTCKYMCQFPSELALRLLLQLIPSNPPPFDPASVNVLILVMPIIAKPMATTPSTP
jgi:hypothetical protein